MAQDTSTLGEVIVTAQKREQSLQDVPISIKALDSQTLDELNIQNFKDYVQFLPTVTMAASDGAGSGYNAVYMRGVATGGDGQATTSLPSVGMYLDEQPITTIQGNLDVHLYDIARVEALAGPQGTLYGASSQAGTIRIITNKPDPSGFDASYRPRGQLRRRGRARLRRGRHGQPADRRKCRCPARRLGQPRRGLDRQRRSSSGST